MCARLLLRQEMNRCLGSLTHGSAQIATVDRFKDSTATHSMTAINDRRYAAKEWSQA